MLNLIIPIHTTENGLGESFKTLVDRITKQKDTNFTVTVVYKKDDELAKFVRSVDFEKTKVKFLENSKNTDFQSQVNLGVEKATGDYIAIIEADDEINDHYVYNVNKHIEAYPEIEVFLPIVVESKPNGEFLSLTNESVWAMNLTEKIGYLDNETLKEYENYQISGMVINKKTYKEVGGLKKNIKLTFGYEFLLRLTEKGKTIYVIPKNIYRHVNMREGSLFWDYQQGVDKITPDEAKFWMETAKKEYFHTKDREINLEKTNV